MVFLKLNKTQKSKKQLSIGGFPSNSLFEFNPEIYVSINQEYKKYYSTKHRYTNIQFTSVLEDIFFSGCYLGVDNKKTKLASMISTGKNEENIEIILKIAKCISPSLNSIIKENKIEYIAFIPPTKIRKVQFIDVIRSALELNLVNIELKKCNLTQKQAEQKSLRDYASRYANAKDSIILTDPNLKINGNVLIFDDVVETGVSVNECANIIDKFAITEIKIFGYAIVLNQGGVDCICDI